MKTDRNAKRKRRIRPAVCLLLGLALLLVLFGGAMSIGKAYHLKLEVDTERLSPTVAGADARTGLQLVAQLSALSMDEDVALPELYVQNSALGRRFGSTATMRQTLQQIMDYLGSYDARLGNDRSLIREIGALLSGMRAAKIVLLILTGTAILLLALGAGMLFSGRTFPAGVLLGLDALLLGAIPPGLLGATAQLGARFSGALAVAARYGVGFTANLRLTQTGRAQVYLCAGALLLIGAAFLIHPNKRGRAPLRTDNTPHEAHGAGRRADTAPANGG